MAEIALAMGLRSHHSFHAVGRLRADGNRVFAAALLAHQLLGRRCDPPL